jgi:ankyrin repeat protein
MKLLVNLILMASLLSMVLWPIFAECQSEEIYQEYVINGRDKAIEMIKKGFEVKPKSEESAELIQAAISRWDYEFVSLLLEKGVDPNVKSPNEIVAIQVAAGRQLQGVSPEYYQVQQDIIRLLVRNGADIEIVDNDHRTPLMLAASIGNEPALRGLLKFSPRLESKDWHGNTALMMAVVGNHVRCVRFLIEAGADVNVKEEATGKTILMQSVSQDYRYGQDEVITKLLISAGAKVNQEDKNGTTALMYAVQHGKKYAEELLIKAGADSRKIANYRLLNAIENSDVPTAKELIPKIDVQFKDETGNTFLMFAARNRMPETMRQLISAGADVNATDEHGETALMIACSTSSYSDLAVVDVLLEAKAKVDAVDDGGSTAMHRLLNGYRNETLPYVKKLLEAGADPNFIAGEQWPYIFSVVINGNIGLAEILIQYGADVNRKYQNRSSLSVAVENKNAAMTAFLISKGAVDPTIENEAKELAKSSYTNLDDEKLINMIGTDIGSISISMEDTSCCGICPIFSLSIDTWGKVHFDGHENVDIPGAEDYSIPQDRLREILIEALKVNFFELSKPGSISTEFGSAASIINIKWKEKENTLNADADPRLLNLKNKILSLSEVQPRIKTNMEFLQRHAEDTFMKEVNLIYLLNNGLPPSILKLLLAKGVNPNQHDESGYSALAVAAGHGLRDSFELTQILLDAGAEVDSIVLTTAGVNSETDILDLLFRYINGTSALKRATPLHSAAFNVDSLKSMKFFLSKGFDVNGRDQNGDTPLIIAAGKRNLPAVELLIAAGADVNLASNSGLTALLAALYQNGTPARWSPDNHDNIEVMKLLLAAGANMNIKVKDGRTPLHLAVMGWDYDATHLLIQEGANSHIHDNYGKTPIDYAKDYRIEAFLELFAIPQ